MPRVPWGLASSRRRSNEADLRVRPRAEPNRHAGPQSPRTGREQGSATVRTVISRIYKGELLMVAPPIQEEILFLPPVGWGRDPILIWQVLGVAAAADWRSQRSRWKRLQLGR